MMKEEKRGYAVEGSERKITALQKWRSRRRHDWPNGENVTELVMPYSPLSRGRKKATVIAIACNIDYI